jgi:hypothetical protein
VRPSAGPAAYKDRNVVERCISKLKQFRAVATRYDKRAFVYDGTLDVASIKIWLRDLTQDLPDTTQRGFTPARRAMSAC